MANFFTQRPGWNKRIWGGGIQCVLNKSPVTYIQDERADLSKDSLEEIGEFMSADCIVVNNVVRAAAVAVNGQKPFELIEIPLWGKLTGRW